MDENSWIAASAIDIVLIQYNLSVKFEIFVDCIDIAWVKISLLKYREFVG